MILEIMLTILKMELSIGISNVEKLKYLGILKQKNTPKMKCFIIIRKIKFSKIFYNTFTNSTSKTNHAFAGITPPAPLSPYPNVGGINNVAVSPSFRSIIPSSHPLIT